MILLRCTQKILKGSGFTPEADPPAPELPLGEWYVNTVPLPFRGRSVVMYTSASTLITVVAPGRALRTTLPVFQQRLPALLARMELPVEWVARHAVGAQEVRVARTASRRVLGSMNDLAKMLWFGAERFGSFEELDLGWLELDLARTPMSMLEYNPRAAVEVLAFGARIRRPPVLP